MPEFKLYIAALALYVIIGNGVMMRVFVGLVQREAMRREITVFADIGRVCAG